MKRAAAATTENTAPSAKLDPAAFVGLVGLVVGSAARSVALRVSPAASATQSSVNYLYFTKLLVFHHESHTRWSSTVSQHKIRIGASVGVCLNDAG